MRTLATRLFALLAVLALAALPAVAQDTPALPTPEETDAALAAVQARLDEAQDRLDGLPEDAAAEDPVAAVLRREAALLGELRAELEDQKSAHARAEELTARRQALDAAAASSGHLEFDHPPPFTIAELDKRLDAVAAAEQRASALGEALKSEDDAFEAARAAREAAERKVRELESSLEDADGAEAATQRQDLALARLQAELERERERSLALILGNDRRAQAIENDQARLDREAAAWVRERLGLRPGELQDTLAQLAAEEKTVEGRLAEVRLELRQADSHWDRVQQRLAAAVEVSPALQDEADARRAVLTAVRRRVEILQDRAQRLPLLREAWELRFKALRGELRGDALTAARARLRVMIGEHERTLQRLSAALDGAPVSADEAAARWQDLRDDGEEKLQKLRAQELHNLENDTALLRRTLGEVEKDINEVRFDEMLDQIRSRIGKVWTMEIFVVQGSSITLGKMIMALLLVLVGYVASQRLSRFLTRRVLQRFNLDEGVMAALQSLTFYTLLVLFMLGALNLVGIPLTVFTVLGGAVAIGIGFGSQNIMNNFMSGLILMIERPVKVGDLVDIGGKAGRVEHIGPRSTWIRSGDNIHMIVPNSNLLESQVLNWTLSDNLLRTEVNVGVAYGTDVQLTRTKLAEATAACPSILEDPPPEILFVDFGDNALGFRVLFWTHVRAPMDLDRAQSELRFAVDAAMNEAGIVIAFPQRDVHLDTTAPLEIRLRRDSGP